MHTELNSPTLTVSANSPSAPEFLLDFIDQKLFHPLIQRGKTVVPLRVTAAELRQEFMARKYLATRWLLPDRATCGRLLASLARTNPDRVVNARAHERLWQINPPSAIASTSDEWDEMDEFYQSQLEPHTEQIQTLPAVTVATAEPNGMSGLPNISIKQESPQRHLGSALARRLRLALISAFAWLQGHGRRGDTSTVSPIPAMTECGSTRKGAS